jgi:hypothetical protein
VCEVSGAGDVGAVTVRARLAGLFGDTWVGCQVAQPSDRPQGDRAAVAQRAQQWCTEVVTAMSARP